jgi:hypothetical protein
MKTLGAGGNRHLSAEFCGLAADIESAVGVGLFHFAAASSAPKRTVRVFIMRHLLHRNVCVSKGELSPMRGSTRSGRIGVQQCGHVWRIDRWSHFFLTRWLFRALRGQTYTWLRGGELRLIGPAVGLPLFPVRSDVRADHAAFRADHARSELADQEIARVLVDVRITSCRQPLHLMSSERTPFLRMFAKSMGSNSYLSSRRSTGHHSASRARTMAGLSGFLTFSQSRDGPDL